MLRQKAPILAASSLAFALVACSRESASTLRDDARPEVSCTAGSPDELSMDIHVYLDRTTVTYVAGGGESVSLAWKSSRVASEAPLAEAPLYSCGSDEWSVHVYSNAVQNIVDGEVIAQYALESR